MAIYHMEAKVLSRGAGRSACAASAYLSCSAIFNEYDGIQHDYTRKGGLVWQQVFLPENAPAEWQDRETLWNAVEAAEKTKDSRLAREFILALPVELNRKQWIGLLTGFVQKQFVADGMCADAAVHDTDGHNPHAHILLTVRPLDKHGKWQHKTEKEYLCVRDSQERGFTAEEYLIAQIQGWEKQYPYKVGKKKEYLPPSQAMGLVRASKYPKNTKFGRQNPISARWNSEEQLLVWREAWAEAVNWELERAGLEERIDHRSHADRGLDEKPTIHEGFAARMAEKGGGVSERCEINRQIRADNALIRALKSTIQKLAEAVVDTVAGVAAAMETARENLMVFQFGLLHIRRRKESAQEYLTRARPQYRSYTELSQQIQNKQAEKKDLQQELEALPVRSVLKRRQLKAQLLTISEELSELENEALRIAHSFGKERPEELKMVKADIADTEKALGKYDQQETTLNNAIQGAKAEFDGLKQRSASLDPDELTAERLAIRPAHESRARNRMQAALGGERLGLWDFTSAVGDTDALLGEVNLAADYEERLRRMALEERIHCSCYRRAQNVRSQSDGRRLVDASLADKGGAQDDEHGHHHRGCGKARQTGANPRQSGC